MTRVDTSAVWMPLSSQILLLLFQEAGDFDNLIVVVLMKMLLLAIADHILQWPYRVNLKPNIC